MCGMTDATARIRYSGDMISMRRLVVCLREEGLQVTVESQEERRDVLATVLAVLAIAQAPGTVADLAALGVKIRSAIRKYREMGSAGDEQIEVLEPDDAGFLNE
jgi:hypothetical protein